MIDLWELLVINVFGSFWLAVMGITTVMWIIFTIGKVSQVTSMNFLLIFMLCMSIGYGYGFISIVITLLILMIHMFAVPRLINSG